MKYTRLLSLTFVLILSGCNHDTKPHTQAKVNSKTINSSDNNKDKEEIQTLIRQMLKWAEVKGEGAMDLLPITSKGSICTGFDFEKLNQNIEKLRRSGFFADEFINNYKQIIGTLDKKIKNKEFEPWDIRELPTFNFNNDVDPWCDCQDNMSWDNIEVKVIKLRANKGELEWNWGKLGADVDSSWKTFAYPFRVTKVDNKWKISYLAGFDYNESIR